MGNFFCTFLGLFCPPSPTPAITPPVTNSPITSSPITFSPIITPSPVLLLGPGWYISNGQGQGCHNLCRTQAGVPCVEEALNLVDDADKVLFLDQNLVNSVPVCGGVAVPRQRVNAPYYTPLLPGCTWNINGNSFCGSLTPNLVTRRFCCCGTSTADCPIAP